MTKTKNWRQKFDTRFIVRIDGEVWRRFLEACHDEGRSASEVLRSFIEAYLQKRRGEKK